MTTTTNLTTTLPEWAVIHPDGTFTGPTARPFAQALALKLNAEGGTEADGEGSCDHLVAHIDIARQVATEKVAA